MPPNSRNVIHALWLGATTAALLQALAGRFFIEPDGLNYLDVADAYLRHDYKNAINSYWSPFYSWLLAASVKVFRPSLYEESTVLHGLNFLLFLFALVCFTVFLRELVAWLGARHRQDSEVEDITPWTWYLFSYVLFTYAMLFLIRLDLDTPDLCVAAWFFLATSIVLRIGRTGPQWLNYVALGGVLGLGYLTKAVMFPLAFAFLFCAALSRADLKNGRWIGISLIAFLLVSGPYLWVLSRAKGRLTFGDAGRLNYAFYIDGLVKIPHWHGEIPGLGTPTHGTHTVFTHPLVEEFATPIGGTYPPWYDPSYWLDGVKPHFDLRGQVRALLEGAKVYATVVAAERVLAVVFLILFLLVGRPWAYLRDLAALWILWVPAAVTLILYAIVHVETRFLGAAVVILWLSVFAPFGVSRHRLSPRLLNAAEIGMAIALATAIIGQSAHDFSNLLHAPRHEQWEIAMGLRQRGLREGEAVAVLGHSSVADYWAHLAGSRVVADIPVEYLGDFWGATPAQQKQVLDVIAHTGAKFLITRETPPPNQPQPWQKIAMTEYYELPLPLDSASAPALTATSGRPRFAPRHRGIGGREANGPN